MQIELKIQGIPSFLEKAYSADEDDIRSILIDVCRGMRPLADFHVQGFGQDRWPVDVETDLPIFLEQLPLVLAAVKKGEDTGIDFYGQGVERLITLQSMGGEYIARCMSGTKWEPIPEVEEIQRPDLEKMLIAARDNFFEMLKKAKPSLAAHPWIDEWLG